MKKVVLLGDSIRLGYQPYLTELLKGRAEVGGIEDNGRFSLYTAWNVLAFLKATGSEADVIHWNNGLWDALYPMKNTRGICAPSSANCAAAGQTPPSFLRPRRRRGRKTSLHTMPT